MDKKFSRKGAKAQRKSSVRSFSFAPLRLCGRIFAVVLLLTICIPVLSQTKAARFDPDGSFWIIGDHGDGFSDFGGINLNAKRHRRLPPSGVQLMDGKSLRFKTLTVKRENFTFTTVSIRGISYGFAGRFLQGGVYAATDLSDERPVLEGVLTKYRSGKKVAEAKLKFMYFGGT